MKNLIYSFAIIATFLCSCEKAEVVEPEIQNITLRAKEITKISDVKLFAGTTQIQEKKKINKFISDAECFVLPTNIRSIDDVIIGSIDDVLVFNSKDSATFGTDPWWCYSVQKNANRFLFYSFQNIFFSQIKIVCLHPLIKYTAELIPIPPVTIFSHVSKDVKVGYGSYTDMEICFVAFKIVKQNSLGYAYIGGWGTFLNEFNEEAIKTLQPSDTLAIKEYRIRFVAK
jgi:hypothetical protein